MTEPDRSTCHVELKYHQGAFLGAIYPDIGFIIGAANVKCGVEIVNTGTERPTVIESLITDELASVGVWLIAIQNAESAVSDGLRDSSTLS